MPSKKAHKAQAALEYLITYGWALVAIATIVGVLVFVAGGGVNTNTCTTFLTMICKGIGVDGDTLVMVLQNSSGQRISINPFSDICFDNQCGYATIEYNGTTYRFETAQIDTGAQFTILGAGQVLASEIRITYVEQATGLEKTVTSTMGTEAPDDIELSNDGKDTDGDGLVDCKDPDVTGPCEYIVENGTPSATTIPDGSNITITFGKPEIAGEWAITTTTIAFYVTSGAGAEAKAKPTAIPTWSSPITVKTGWNYIETSDIITLESGNEFDLGVSGSDIIISNEDEKKPKAVMTLEP